MLRTRYAKKKESEPVFEDELQVDSNDRSNVSITLWKEYYVDKEILSAFYLANWFVKIKKKWIYMIKCGSWNKKLALLFIVFSSLLKRWIEYM